MTELRQKMIRAMELENLSDNTQRRYLAAVTGLAKHYRQSPDQLAKEMIEDYLLYLKNDKGNAPNSCASTLSGLRFFYKHVTKQKIRIDYSLVRRVQKLPTVLPQEDVWNIINAPDNIKHHLILMTTYSAGLRASEVIALTPESIDSKRMLIKVKGKGGKDRYTLLAKRLLPQLRHYYRTYRPQTYLFPSSLKQKTQQPKDRKLLFQSG
jgi:site-specific recombinase XerD